LYDFQADGNSPRTTNLYRMTLPKLVEFLGDPEVEQIKFDDLQRYMMYLRTEYVPKRLNGDTSPLSGSSLDNYWKGIRGFFRWCNQALEIPRPDLKLKQPKYAKPVKTPFSETEIKALIKACEYTTEAKSVDRRSFRMKRPTAARDRALVLFLLDTGLRVGEVTRLTIEDVNLELGEVLVGPYGKGIKSRPRIVYLGKTARRAMWLYLSKHRADAKPSERLFEMDGDTIRQLLRKLGERAGVKNVHPHRFRHTFAIMFLRNGGNIFFLQKLLGHANLEMVKVYLNIVQSDVSQAHSQASPADNWKL
jgi:integrase/recombinase XerD